MTLTLQTIKDNGPNLAGWKAITKAIGSDLTTKLSIGDVLISNGLDDALWCLRCLEPRVRVAAIMPAVKRASVHTTDQRVHDCIADIDMWLAGDDTVDFKAAKAAEEAARAVKEGSFPYWAAGLAARASEWAGAAAKAARLASWAARAAEEAWEAERELQEADLLAMFPPIILKGQDDE